MLKTLNVTQIYLLYAVLFCRGHLNSGLVCTSLWALNSSIIGVMMDSSMLTVNGLKKLNVF